MLKQPWGLTLWTYYQVCDRERIRGLRKRIETADNATLTALAFNQPEDLEKEQEAARSAARKTPAIQSRSDEALRAFDARLTAALANSNMLEGWKPIGS